MAKRIRRELIHIAPEIVGHLNDLGEPIVLDERHNRELDPYSIDDKIIIYERQVKGWFLNPARRFLTLNNHGFIVLMICLSYLEGVQQYIVGESSNGRSREFFIDSLHRLYPDTFSNNNLRSLYRDARCGLFHTGMVNGQIIISPDFPVSIFFQDAMTIKINQNLLYNDIVNDFNQYLDLLRNEDNFDLRMNFNRMYSNL